MNTNSIAQFNIQFDAVEDRLQLRVLSRDNTEIRVWLTRRYVDLLLNTMPQQLSENSQQKLQAWQPNKGDSLTEQGSDDVRFDEQYLGSDKTERPLGDEPVLVSTIAYRKQENDYLVLIFGQADEEGIKMQISLSDDLAENLWQMLAEACRIAEWHISIKTINDSSAELYTENNVLH